MHLPLRHDKTMSRDYPAYIKKELQSFSSLDEPLTFEDCKEKNKNKKRKKLKFRPYYNPESIFDLLLLEDFYKTLGQSTVFIQKTESLSAKLINRIAKISSKVYKFLYKTTHIDSLEYIYNLISDTANVKKKVVWIIDSTNPEDNIGEFCRKIALLENIKCGVWIRAYISDLHPKDISFFQALFTFDMPDKDFDILRTSIPLSSDNIMQLRESTIGTTENNKVLVFLNYKNSYLAPLLKKNPMVLSPVLSDSFSESSSSKDLEKYIIQIIKGDNFMGDKITLGSNSSLVNRSTVTNSFNQDNKKATVEFSQEVVRLLDQLQTINPSATELEQIKYIDIVTPPPLKQRLISAFKEGADTAMDELVLDNKYLKVAKAAIKGWIDPS